MQVRSLLVLLSVLAVVLVLPFAVLGQPQTDVGTLHHQPQSEAASTLQATDPPAVAPSDVIAPPAPANPLDSRAGKLLHAFYTAYINGDSNTLLSHVDSGTVFEYNAPPLTPAHPAYGVYHGPEGWNQFLARYQRVFEVTSFIPEVIYGDDHSATSIVHLTFKCTNTGATTSADSIERWTFNGDKVAKASLHLPEAARVESACESDEAAWLREGITAGIAGDSSKLTVHPQATFVVYAPAEWNIAGKYDYTQFVQQVVQVVDTPDITFRILSSGNGTALVEFNYPKYSIRKGIDRSKFTARNVKAFAVYNLVKVETLVEVPQSAPPAVADSGLAGNVAPTPAHLVKKVGFQVSHLKYTIAGSDPVLKVKKAKAESASADLAVEEVVVEEKTKDKKAKKKAEKAQKKAKKEAKK